MSSFALSSVTGTAAYANATHSTQEPALADKLASVNTGEPEWALYCPFALMSTGGCTNWVDGPGNQKVNSILIWTMVGCPPPPTYFTLQVLLTFRATLLQHC